jgi:hypothetical protein
MPERLQTLYLSSFDRHKMCGTSCRLIERKHCLIAGESSVGYEMEQNAMNAIFSKLDLKARLRFGPSFGNAHRLQTSLLVLACCCYSKAFAPAAVTTAVTIAIKTTAATIVTAAAIVTTATKYTSAAISLPQQTRPGGSTPKQLRDQRQRC